VISDFRVMGDQRELPGRVGADASHALVQELDRLAARHDHQITYSAGWELGAREEAAIGKVPGPHGRPRSMAGAMSASAMRVFACRERPHPSAKLSLFETADGWRYSVRITNLPAATRGWRGPAPASTPRTALSRATFIPRH